MLRYSPRPFTIIFALLLVTACVTVNVYFPAAAAEKAADLFICDVYGNCEDKTGADQKSDDDQSRAHGLVHDALVAIMSAGIPAARAAEPDINIATPGINQLKARMTARHQQLVPHYTSGAVGMAANGLITLRDPSAVALKARAQVNTLIADENRDRNALYVEIAQANNNPQWEPDIRRIFGERWVSNAPAGWWYQDGSGWRQK